MAGAEVQVVETEWLFPNCTVIVVAYSLYWRILFASQFSNFATARQLQQGSYSKVATEDDFPFCMNFHPRRWESSRLSFHERSEVTPISHKSRIYDIPQTFPNANYNCQWDMTSKPRGRITRKSLDNRQFHFFRRFNIHNPMSLFSSSEMLHVGGMLSKSPVPRESGIHLAALKHSEPCLSYRTFQRCSGTSST
jgi:hypothetical protein